MPVVVHAHLRRGVDEPRRDAALEHVRRLDEVIVHRDQRVAARPTRRVGQERDLLRLAADEEARAGLQVVEVDGHGSGSRVGEQVVAHDLRPHVERGDVAVGVDARLGGGDGRLRRRSRQPRHRRRSGRRRARGRPPRNGSAPGRETSSAHASRTGRRGCGRTTRPPRRRRSRPTSPGRNRAPAPRASRGRRALRPSRHHPRAPPPAARWRAAAAAGPRASRSRRAAHSPAHSGSISPTVARTSASATPRASSTNDSE